MDEFASYDGTKIGYHTMGAGRPLVCLPGGPGRSCEYFGDLGGLAASRQLIMPDTRGTGTSADATDPVTYQRDRLASDVEALRAHLGLERMDLLGHSAASEVALLYAAAYPSRLDRLILLTPSLSALGIETTDAQQQAAMEQWSAEPWYAGARAAVEKAKAGDRSPETRRGYMPFLYGRWDETTQSHASVGVSERALALQDEFWAEGALDPAATRRALSGLTAPVLIYAGGRDFLPTPEAAAQAVDHFPNAKLVVQPGAAHFPWLDDPAQFTAAISSFLG